MQTQQQRLFQTFYQKGATVADFGGISSRYTGATGLFTALIVGIIALEIFGFLRKMDALKIKMPDQVPPGVAKSFEILIPAFLTVTIVGTLGFIIQSVSGHYVNDVIFQLVQDPLGNIIGNNLLAVLLLFVIISLFWLVGIHGNNMVEAINQSIFRSLLYANTAAYTSATYSGQQDIPNILNLTMLEMFGKWGGGSGLTLSLVIAIFIFGKREDNRAIATLSVVPGLFNINETVTFGMPIVLNPILGIPFILAPMSIFNNWLFLNCCWILSKSCSRSSLDNATIINGIFSNWWKYHGSYLTTHSYCRLCCHLCTILNRL